jgi:hypothetical protein
MLVKDELYGTVDMRAYMIICLSGWKNSGKDTCANYLIEKHNALRISLADPLKDQVSLEFNIDRASLDDPKLKESPILTMPVDPKDRFSRMIAEFMFKEFRNERGGQVSEFDYYNDSFVGKTDDGYGWCKLYWTPRALAILKGSTNRSVRSDFWIQKAFDSIDWKSRQLNVITDVRYQSEIKQIKDKYGDRALFVRVNRYDKSPSEDPSERDLDNYSFEYSADNTGTLEETYAQLEKIYNTVL